MQQHRTLSEKFHLTDQQSTKIQQNPITLLNNPTRFRNSFQAIVALGAKLIQENQYQKSILFFNRSLDMLDLGQEILKEMSAYWKLCVYEVKEIQIFEGSGKQRKLTNAHFLLSEQKVQMKLLLMKKQIKIKFQHCAILSQTNQHNQALELCKNIFQQLQNYLQTILSLINKIELPPKSANTQDSVIFIEEVVGFATQVLTKMLITLKQPIENNSNQRNLPFYFWAKNPDKNQQQIKQLIGRNKGVEECRRSILGVNKNKLSICEFNIGSIMHIQQYNVNQFKKAPPIEQYLFKDQLYQIIIYCSMTFFTLAAQLRFIQSLNNQTISKQDIINKKYGYSQKTSTYKLSEIHHLKSIQIIVNNIPVSFPYLSHIIHSYQKHYIIDKPLPAIKSTIEESLISTVTFKNQKSTEEYQNFDEYLNVGEGYGKFQRKNNRVSRVPENTRNQGDFDQQVREVYRLLSSKKCVKDGGEYQIQQFNKQHQKKKHSSLGKNSQKYKKIIKKSEISHQRSFSQTKIQTKQKKQQLSKSQTPQRKLNQPHKGKKHRKKE